MVPITTVETEISSQSTTFEVTANLQEVTENVSTSFDINRSKELEKCNREYKESSSTQTSSSSSLLHKRKPNSYYAASTFYKTLIANHMMMLGCPKRTNVHSTTQRIISAKFLRFKQLQSELTQAQKKIAVLEEENRTLKTIHKRQDSALRKYESQESYLPQLLKSHEEEMRILTLKYKKIRGSYNDLDSRYNKQFIELTSIRDRYNHLSQISQDKHLLQRERLTKQIEDMKITINELKNKLKLQSRRLDLEVKNYKHQLVVEFQKQKNLRDQLKQLQNTIEKMKTSLEEKERIITICKMNHVVHKTSQSRINKITTSSLKPMRSDASPDNDNSRGHAIMKIEQKNDTGTEEELPISISKPSLQMNSEENTDRPKYTEPEVDDRKSNDLGTEGEALLVPVSSDSNNNKKLNLFVDVNVEKASKGGSTFQKNFSLEIFESCEKIMQDDETSSDKSEDFRHIEDAISWLEVHEKTNCDDPFHKIIRNERRETQSTILSSAVFNNKPIIKSDVQTRSPQFVPTTNGAIEADKKAALLRSLKQIDFEIKQPAPSFKSVLRKSEPSKNNTKTKKSSTGT